MIGITLNHGTYLSADYGARFSPCDYFTRAIQSFVRLAAIVRKVFKVF